MGKNDRMFVHKVLHAIALTTIALNSVAEDSCTKDKAFEIAMEHLRLNQMYLEKYEPYKLFESSASDATWAVFGVGGVPKGMLGGGSPTVIISSESCEVEKAYYAR